MVKKRRGNRQETFTVLLAIFLIFTVFTEGYSAVDNKKENLRTIKGSVWYRERIMLPSDAVVRVTLEDVSKADVKAEVIATTSFATRGAPPWDFILEFDPARISDKNRYAIRARIEADGHLMFINKEHIPAFADHSKTPLKILVSRTGDKGNDNALSSGADARLTGTYWKLIEIDDLPVLPGAEGKDLHMVLKADTTGVNGFSGCNRFTGGYKLKNTSLQFGPLAGTMMMCADGAEQEKRFLDTLALVERFIIRGQNLTLYSGDNKPVLRFHSVTDK